MRNARPAVTIAALLVPLLWTGALWAELEPTQTIDNAETDDAGGYGGGVTPQPALSNEGTVTGVVVGTNCWLARGLAGDKYRDSAVACARNGTPLAILTDDGELLYPIRLDADNTPKPDIDRLLPYAEQRVSVSGRLIRRGKARAIVVNSIDEVVEPRKMRAFGVKERAGAQLVGRVVDLSCWFDKGEAGTANASCMSGCATDGDPLVIVTDAGRLYYPVTKAMPKGPVGSALLSGYCARRVRVFGTTIDRGMGRGIIIDRVEPLSAR